MKKLLILLTSILFASISFGQVDNKYAGKTYIFDFNEKILRSDGVGENTGNPIIALAGSLFSVVKVLDKVVVIKFNKWRGSDPQSIANREKYNFASQTDKSKTENTDELLYFVLEKDLFNKVCSEYKKWNIGFGTFTTPFKLRSKPFIFTTDLNLGASISFTRKFSGDFYWGIIGGLSLSSVKLDSASTNGTIKTPSDRPAITPSINALFGYKNINLIFGVGIDYISQTSKVEQSWIYHKKPWFGVGIGISLFNRSTEDRGTQPIN